MAMLWFWGTAAEFLLATSASAARGCDAVGMSSCGDGACRFTLGVGHGVTLGIDYGV